MDISSPEIFEYPFLYMSGRYEFEMPDSRAIDNLRRHLTYGGFLLIDDGLGLEGEAFGGAVRELMRLVFPRTSFEALPARARRVQELLPDSLRRRATGRQPGFARHPGGHVHPRHLLPKRPRRRLGEGVRGADGWKNAPPGGEPQRLAAFQLAVNISLYAMTGNYKQDLIHHPFIQRRLNQG